MKHLGPLLSIRDFRLDIATFDGVLKVLDGIDLEVAAGEAVGIVGETGCGKSITAKSVLGLVPMPPARIASGGIIFDGQNVNGGGESVVRRLRGREISMIFQDPMTYLNPVFSIGRQLIDVILSKDAHKPRGQRMGRKEAYECAVDLLRKVHLPNPEKQLASYPHHLSGGMRQRILIAMALAGSPQLLIADEPTTALDVTIQAQILDLIHDLIDDLGVALMLISHDLGVVAAVCPRIVVMYAGVIAEDAPSEQLFGDPRHPYTQGLLAAIPRLDGSTHSLAAIPGAIPNLIDPPSGCRFHPRCLQAGPRCNRERPAAIVVGDGHRTACHLYSGGVS